MNYRVECSVFAFSPTGATDTGQKCVHLSWSRHIVSRFLARPTQCLANFSRRCGTGKANETVYDWFHTQSVNGKLAEKVYLASNLSSQESLKSCYSNDLADFQCGYDKDQLYPKVCWQYHFLSALIECCVDRHAFFFLWLRLNVPCQLGTGRHKQRIHLQAGICVKKKDRETERKR